MCHFNGYLLNVYGKRLVLQVSFYVYMFSKGGLRL